MVIGTYLPKSNACLSQKWSSVFPLRSHTPFYILTHILNNCWFLRLVILLLTGNQTLLKIGNICCYRFFILESNHKTMRRNTYKTRSRDFGVVVAFRTLILVSSSRLGLARCKTCKSKTKAFLVITSGYQSFKSNRFMTST